MSDWTKIMGDVKVVIELPEELVTRAKAVGVRLDSQTDQIIALLEAQIRRREAAQRLTEIAEQLQALPPELKPTPDEIEAEIRAYWAEKTSQDNTSHQS